MELTEQYLTPEQIKRGFTIEKQGGVASLILKHKKLFLFKYNETPVETIQNTANTIWEAYSLGYKDALRITRSDKLFDTVAEDII